MSLLEQFDHLRNNDSRRRQQAILGIFAILDIHSKPVVSIETQDDLKEAYGTEIEYTYTRLIRGLASSRESARLGFSAALSELLRALPKIDTQLVLDSIEKATTTTGNVKGQEIRDFQFGRLFGLQALCTSGLLKRKSTTMEDITPVLVLLYELAMSKGWLRESCMNVVLQILESLAQAKSSITAECANSIHEMLHTAQLSKTIEGLAVHLKCVEHGSTIRPVGWSNSNIIHGDNMTVLNKVLRDQHKGDAEAEKDTQIGTWKPKLHFAWLIIIRAILQPHDDGRIQFADFWRIVVDEGLFSASASHERKFWGFQLFDQLVKDLPHDKITILFSANFLRTLCNQISQSDRFLNKAAKNSMISMVISAEAENKKAIVILAALWNFNLFFDRLSKEKPCEKLMHLVPNQDKLKLVDLLISHCNLRVSSDYELKSVEKQRQFVADSLLINLRAPKALDAGSWITKILEFFVFNGYFRAARQKKSHAMFTPELSDVTRQVLRSRFQSALGILMPTTATGPETAYIVSAIESFSKFRGQDHVEILLRPDEAISNVLNKAEKRMTKIHKKWLKSHQHDQQAFAFLLLYSLTIAQVYDGESDAVQVLEDLEGCQGRLSKQIATEEFEQDPLEVLMELLLSFLAKEGVLFRKLAETVFTVFADQIKRASMQLLLDVLVADESGQDLFDKIEEEDGLIDSADDEEADEDEDMIAADELERNGSGSDSDEDDDEIDDLDLDNEDNTERDAALDAALAAALGGTKRKASEMDGRQGVVENSDFEADSDEEEELMDDDQMLAMDAALENIFKRRKQETGNTKKQDRNEMRTQTNQFKRKVLDLLEIFIKSCPSSDLTLDMLLPLLISARRSSDDEYTRKAQNFIRQSLTKHKVVPETKRASDEVLALLRQTHREAERSTTPPAITAASQTSLFLVRVLVSTFDPSTTIDTVLQVYADTQSRWINRKNSRLSTGFFVDFINWSTQWRVNRHKKDNRASPVVETATQVDKGNQSESKSHGKKSKGKKKKR